jgi:hypothetical protein
MFSIVVERRKTVGIKTYPNVTLRNVTASTFQIDTHINPSVLNKVQSFLIKLDHSAQGTNWDCGCTAHILIVSLIPENKDA